MGVLIPDDSVQATRMTEDELRREIAVLLFERDKLTLAQAARLAGMHRLAFQHLLASRRVAVHYDVADLDEDLEVLRRLQTS